MTVDELARYRKIPPPLANATEGKMLDTPAMKHVAEVLASKNTALCVLSGSAGCGKTVAAAWACSRNQITSALWIPAPKLAKVPKSIDNEDVRDPLTRACEVALLVVDDLGIEHSPGGYAGSRLAEAFEHRELYRLKTIITTNLSAGDFLARYGERLLSRVNGDTIGWRECGTTDLRAKAKP